MDEGVWVYVMLSSGRANVTVGTSEPGAIDAAFHLLRERLPEAEAVDSTVPVSFWAAGRYSSSIDRGHDLCSRRDSDRSASSVPPVWQRAQ